MLRNYCIDLGNEGKDDEYGYGVPDFKELKISDIDKLSPEIVEVNYDDEKWEKNKDIFIKAKDEIRILGWGITDKDEKPQEINKLDILSTSLDVKANIEKNGKYYIWVFDSAENASKKEIEINKIDIIEPKIEYKIDNTKQDTENYITISVIGTDEQSGLHETPYSWDGLAWGKDNKEYKVTTNGLYTVYVRDNMENIAIKQINITSFPEQGRAIIDEGNIIKEIVVSSDWEGNTNKDVKIVLNNNLNIMDWRITDTNIMPREFENNSSENEEIEETEQTEENIINNNTDENVINNNITYENIINDDNRNVPNVYVQNTYTIQGYSNLTLTVSLDINVDYYLWIKKNNGNVDIQSFRIEK